MTKRRVVEMQDGTYRVQYRVWPLWYTHNDIMTSMFKAVDMYNELERLEMREKKKNKIKSVVHP